MVGDAGTPVVALVEQYAHGAGPAVLVAVAAVPGSLLPQRNVSDNAVRDYYAAHPALAPVLDRLGGFAVFESGRAPGAVGQHV